MKSQIPAPYFTTLSDLAEKSTSKYAKYFCENPKITSRDLSLAKPILGLYCRDIKVPMFIPFHELKPKVDITDWYFATEATFEVVGNSQELWETMIDTLAKQGYEYYISESGSEYLSDTVSGDIYRYADHWGRIASCNWYLQDLGNDISILEGVFIGKSNLSIFRRQYSRCNILNESYGPLYLSAKLQEYSNYCSVLESTEIKITPAVRRKLEESRDAAKSKIEEYEERGMKIFERW